MSEHNRAITILEKELQRLVESAKENRRVEFERRTWAENQEKEADQVRAVLHKVTGRSYKDWANKDA